MSKSARISILAQIFSFFPLVTELGLVERVIAEICFFQRFQHPQLITAMGKMTIVTQLTKVLLRKHLTKLGLVKRVLGYDSLFSAWSYLLLWMGKTTLVSVTAASCFCPVFAHLRLDVVWRIPWSSSRPSNASQLGSSMGKVTARTNGTSSRSKKWFTHFCFILSTSCCITVPKLAIWAQVTVTLNNVFASTELYVSLTHTHTKKIKL